jgi:hypothetical protein
MSNRWSSPKPLGTWADIYGVSAKTFSRWLKAQVIPHKKLSRLFYMIDVNALPERWRSLYANGHEETQSEISGKSNLQA